MKQELFGRILDTAFFANPEKPIALSSEDIYWKLEDPTLEIPRVKEVLEALVQKGDMEKDLGKYVLNRFCFFDLKKKHGLSARQQIHQRTSSPHPEPLPKEEQRKADVPQKPSLSTDLEEKPEQELEQILEPAPKSEPVPVPVQESKASVKQASPKLESITSPPLTTIPAKSPNSIVGIMILNGIVLLVSTILWGINTSGDNNANLELLDPLFLLLFWMCLAQFFLSFRFFRNISTALNRLQQEDIK